MVKLKGAVKQLTASLPPAWSLPLAEFAMLVNHDHWRRVRTWRTFLQQSQCWSAEQLQDYQWSWVSTLLRHAYAQIPYYRHCFERLGAHPQDFREPGDMARFPTLSKADLQEQLDDLVAADCPPHRRRYVTTGGSTGMPVGLYQDHPDSDAIEAAFITTLWQRVGYRDHDRTAILRGTALPAGRLWQFNHYQRALVLSSYHLTEMNIPAYLAQLRRYQPAYIQAYPSAITLLARHMLNRGDPPVAGVRAILCGSENLYPWQRRYIEEAFRCRVFSWYGLTERVCLAGSCEHDDRLHIFPEYSFTELVDAEGRVIDQPDVVGEIVGTGFLSRCMPLIRYRTTDIAMYAAGYCAACGRKYRLLQRIEGRLQEFIVTRSGRLISMTAINMHSPVFDHVRQFRFYQDTPGQVVLKILPKASYHTQRDEAGIRRELAPKLGDDITLVIELVTELSVTLRGKYRFLDQRLPLGVGDG